MGTSHLSGVVPVLATPFGPDLTVDYVSLRRLIAFELESGARGLAVFGLASEAFALSTAERERILAETVSMADGAVPVIAGVTPTSLESARERLAECASGGAQIAMVMPPHFVKPSAAQIVDFFGQLSSEAETLGIEMMIQDAPGATGVTMDVGTLARCATFPAVTSIKVEAPPTAPKIRALADRLDGTDVVLLGGQNAQFLLEELAAGATGTMPACEFTDLLAPVVASWQTGDEESARDDFTQLLPLIIWGLQPGLGWAVHKEVLVARGIFDCAAVRAPASPLTEFSRRMLEPIITRLGLSARSTVTT